MADLQILKALLPDNPLCGINTYKDTLNLATGDCTRQIKKFVLTGEETDWGMVESYTYFRLTNFEDGIVGQVVCSHYISPPNAISIYNTVQGIRIQDSASYGRILIVRPPNFMTETLSGFKTYLQQQYAAGTPVTVWYVLVTPTTETITVPSGLSGIEEGYLDQSDTPTPTNPVYPTANEVPIWQHSLRKLTSNGWVDASVKQWDGSQWQ